ncbi:NodT family efflux transporter outer membrane factor (OMF) lipoprotein [Sphingomonas naasensis]|uniref:Efflux transporter outer membrane subunit n=1 Tax=Sphingomonas naasensis TaxID=1344951 RepID=A0A4V6RB61_9SPHN|nr:efflux transporter outer membrane subunit [Sphingomonas naasensis]NIJ19108.1 NodT family efflux transporter outer membrane factor (OMF) lipoprotein [Sphingomonas naasensis]TGX46302.1 efflux transporter outer membrane subunit [Sphingomonas naasensis]
MPRLSLLALPLLAAGCTVGPDYQRPAPTAASQSPWLEPGAPGAVDLAWWDSFGDPELSALVHRALTSAPDLKEAEARLAEARANRDAVAGGRLPGVEAKGSATENRLSENGQLPIGNIPGVDREFRLFDLGFDASWELDFWGRRTRQIEAANARAEAALFGQRDVMLTLIGEVARSYFDLRAAQADAASAQALATADAELARLTRLRVTVGESSQLELERAEAAARTSAAAMPDVEARAAAAAYRIATLVGAAPEEVAPRLRQPAPLPASPDRILVGIRSDLLERRPDIRRAERELAAATADIGVATADLFPRFSLFGSIGQQARTPGDLFAGESTRLQIGPSFSWPIFSGGTIRAQIRAADARAQGAAARYEKAVLGALGDSEAAINRFLNAGAAEAEAGAALERERAAYALAEKRQARGEDDRLTLLRARESLLASERRADQARAAKGQAAVALYKALGGGWR